jgi:hypothetical protein
MALGNLLSWFKQCQTRGVSPGVSGEEVKSYFWTRRKKRQSKGGGWPFSLPPQLFDKLSTTGGRKLLSKEYKTEQDAYTDLLGALSHFVRIEPLTAGGAKSAVVNTMKRVIQESDR